MVRCVDFYKKWEKDPNWCEKTKGAVSLINSYLDLVNDIHGRGIDKEVVYVKFPETSARPVFSIKDPEIRVKIMNYICSCLNRSEKISAGDLKNLVSSYEGKEKPEKHAEDRPEEFTKVNQSTPDCDVKPPIVQSGQTLAQKYGGKDGADHAPPVITDTDIKVSPSTDTQTVRPEDLPFRTALEAKQGLMAPDREVKPDTGKLEREQLEACAEELLERMPQSIQLIATDQMRDHPSWKVKDFWYFSAIALSEGKGKK